MIACSRKENAVYESRASAEVYIDLEVNLAIMINGDGKKDSGVMKLVYYKYNVCWVIIYFNGVLLYMV